MLQAMPLKVLKAIKHASFLYLFIKEKEASVTMPVTHADFALAPKKSYELGSKNGAYIMVLSIFLGLCCFVLCVVAEATRSEVTWIATSDIGRENTYECVYKGSGSVPLWCGVIAFLGLAVAVVVAHVFLVVVVSNNPPPALMYYDPDSSPAKVLTWQAGILFGSIWVAFLVGEILLLIGLAIESGHLKNWSTPRSSCLVLRPGIFSTAGVFSLITVSLSVGLYITISRAQALLQDEERASQEVATTATNPSTENTVMRENRSLRPLTEYLTGFNKACDSI